MIPHGLFLFPILAFLAVLALVPVARRLAVRAGYVDTPGGRKAHHDPTPPVGGLVIMPVFILLSFLSGGDIHTQWPFWLGLCVLTLAGTLDDRFAVRPLWKFAAQFAAAGLIVIPGGATVTNLGDTLGFGTLWLGFMAVPFSVIAAVLLINAINLIDGLDGLAGGAGFVTLFWLLVSALLAPQGGHALSILMMMGVLVGFLAFNMRHPWRAKASIFLGDAGSLPLGLALAWFGMTLGRDGTLWPMAVAWILALPIMDTCAQFARRVAQGRHPFDADRNHFHHHFIDAGIPVGRATAMIAGIVFILGLIGVGGMVLHVPEPVLGWMWIAVILTHMWLSLRPERYRAVFAFFARRDGA